MARCPLPSRRMLLASLPALALWVGPAGPALAAEPAKPVKKPPPKSQDPDAIRYIHLTPILVPGKERLGYARLLVDLVVRKSGSLAADVETVSSYRPRIIGTVTEALAAEELVRRDATPADLARMKARIRDIANTAVGKDLVEDVFVVSLFFV
ncbi:hypothetical protein HHL28_16370 [Aerophototrophica crusticola]|uniref:Flagellar protein FliL n=1 Tax=Aerophototrophica crusticola TaxID=1709002 RepID=A0A858RAQ4_9PROT|nr:hypothetical protein HHL28_16370 [Rhodospirillaceae bacterium B3]